ncbi:MAG: MFS transporter [Oscillospiraceae bacterium]|nr:MFS transporter [Oscillospiraceae bacterium]
MAHLLLAVIYAAFIAFGLPDSLLGSVWPTMYPQMEVPVSYAGMVSLIIAIGTVISSLLSDRTTKKLGCGKVAAISVGMTAAALLGFSFSRSFRMLCLWAIPYGLGAGGVDAALNNYVALHYSSKHMSWLHCMWGVGASVGPYIMGFSLTGGLGWPAGYQIVAAIQIVITLILVLSLPLWKGRGNDGASRGAVREQPLKLTGVLRIPGAKEVLLMFFCYCALEQTAGLWAASYLVMKDGLPAENAASYASLFYLGITAGRGISGFVTMKLNDTRMIRLGLGILTAGVLVMLLPLGTAATVAGLLLIGLGCAPIYPCVIHSTPAHFGADKSQAIIGVQMASAYTGICVIPPLFGLIANHIGAWLLPVFLAVILVLMIVMHEKLVKVCPID